MKELRDYLKLIKKYFWLFMVLILVAVASAVGWSLTQPVVYLASTTLYVNRVPEPSNDRYYTYEGYYSGLASKEYTDVVVGLLKTPDIANLAASKAGLDITSAALGAKTQVRKASPQLISVSVTHSEPDSAKKLINALSQAVAEKSKNLTQAANRGVEVSMINPEPQLDQVHPNWLLNGLIALTGAFLAGLGVAVIREYLRP